jgi:hypothetical protein
MSSVIPPGISGISIRYLPVTITWSPQEVLETDFQTGEVISGKYKIRYSFECYDITTSATIPGDEPQTSQPEPSIWERGTADACTILYNLSKDKKI